MNDQSERRVIAIQQGARRNYVYARQLEAEGLLNYLACDIAWTPEGSQVARWLVKKLAPHKAGAIGRRTIAEIDPMRVRSTMLPNLLSTIRSFIDEERFLDLQDELLAFSLRRKGLSQADIVLSYFGNGGSFLNVAKRQGARIITDFISSPHLRQVERREQLAWPGWDHETVSAATIETYRRRCEWLLKISDIYLCPSLSVARDLAESHEFDHSRVRIVPYGTSGALRLAPRTKQGRVLFAGSCVVRKGLPYLAQAALLLKQEHPEIDILAAGNALNLVRNRAETRAIKFLGHLDPQSMAEEFASADVFCLPSLSEGSSTAVYEALAHGLPVVTTAESGSVVQDGVEGIIVPPRDSKAIADSISAIVGDRVRRSAMSAAALSASARHNEVNCGRNFVEVIREQMNISERSQGRPLIN